MSVVRTKHDLWDPVRRWREAGQRIALVPTMGALHDGHLSLTDLARRHADRVVVSIFVNPTQFGPNEDLDNYPRDEAQDLRRLADRGADLAYLPTVGEIYPEGFATHVGVAGVTSGLCGDHRPGHFQGVATVVTKLLNQCAPDIAVFGEKDYQQLIVIKQLVRDLDMPVTILGAPIVRDDDGLALSSRNAYLSARERLVAARLNRVLDRVARRIERGGAVRDEIEKGLTELTKAGVEKIDYLEIRDAENLSTVSAVKRKARILAAVRIGQTRLIDNMEIIPAQY
ncbi:MAG: pantoate--beta-alanine ligase [Sphingomonadales bacterium]